MDRTAWIAVILSVIGLVWWNFTYSQKQMRRAEEHQRALAASRAEPHVTPPTTDPAAPFRPSTTPVPARPEPVAEIAPEETLDVVSPEGSVRYSFTNRGGIAKAELLGHIAIDPDHIVINSHGSRPIGALFQVDDQTVHTFQMREERRGTVLLTREQPGEFRLEKRFRLPETEPTKDRYVAELELKWTNLSSASLALPAQFIAAGEIAPIHKNDLIMHTGMDYLREGRVRHTPVTWFDRQTVPLLGIETRPPTPVYTQDDPPVRWVGVRNQFFTSLLTARETEGIGVWAQRVILEGRGNNGSPLWGIETAMRLPPLTIPARQSTTQTFQIYTGPRELARLQRLEHQESEIMNYGFFKLFSEILLHSMNSLKGVTGNYATAIILLTIIIKLLLYPMQSASMHQMKRMSLLSPKMTELREKYKDNPQRMNEEVMKLYKEYGVNPFMGCLPMLLQIPVFFGFFSMLGTAVELRNSSFLWVSDLSQPDTVARMGWLPINVLPLVMAGTMFWQMAITPKTGDKMQQRIFMIMPVIFILFCYNYASALSLYWTVQNLFSIVQLYLTRNKPMPELKKVTESSTLKGGKPKRRTTGRPGGR